jgi:hypothetical protein
VFDVWTDGSIDCEKAVKEASGYLMDHFSLFGELNKRPILDALPEEEDPAEKKKESALSLSVEDLELSARSLNCLKKAGIETVQELVEKDLSELILERFQSLLFSNSLKISPTILSPQQIRTVQILFSFQLDLLLQARHLV